MTYLRPQHYTDFQTPREGVFGPEAYIRLDAMDTPRSGEPMERQKNKWDGIWAPYIDYSETRHEYVVRAEIPGIRPEDIQVDIRDNVLILSGQIRERQKERNEKVFQSEMRFGRFLRQIPFPTEVDVDEAEAEISHGVLEVRVPKMSSSRGKRLKVNRERAY